MSTPAVGVKAASIARAAAGGPAVVRRRPEQLPSQRQIPGGTSWRAFGSEVHLVVGDRDRLETATQLASHLLGEIRRRCDARRLGSDLDQANRSAGSWVPADGLLIAALSASARVSAALGALGGAPGAGQVDVDPAGRVRVPAGGHIDLGTALRAFAADAVAGAVPEQAGTALIVGAGGDVATGPLPGSRRQWRVTLSETGHDQDGEQVRLETGGLATMRLPTSHRGETSPLLDPRTGNRLDPLWRSVTVCAASCLDAHAAASAAMLMGDQAPAWLWEHGLAARLVGTDSLVLRVAGWPDPA